MANYKKPTEKFFISGDGHPKDRVIIHGHPALPKEGLFIGLNGVQHLAPYDIEIDLPRPMRQMLDTRIYTETIQGQDGKTYTRDLRRVNYTLVKEDVGGEEIPAPEVIAAEKAGATNPADIF